METAFGHADTALRSSDTATREERQDLLAWDDHAQFFSLALFFNHEEVTRKEAQKAML